MIAVLMALLAVVNTPNVSSSYACNGVTAAFSVAYPFLSYTDLVVTSTTGPGVVTTLTYAQAKWTISATSTTTTATLTLTNPGTDCPSGSTLKIARTMAYTQPYGFRAQITYNPALHETAYDRLAMEIAQLANALTSGTLTVPSTVVTDSPIIGDGSAGNHVRWNFASDNTWTGGQTITPGVGKIPISALGATSADTTAFMREAAGLAGCYIGSGTARGSASGYTYTLNGRGAYCRSASGTGAGLTGEGVGGMPGAFATSDTGTAYSGSCTGTNCNGGSFTGNGTGYGVNAVAAGSAAGVQATSGTGPAGKFTGNGTRSPIYLVPGAEGSGPSEGEVNYNGTNHLLKVYEAGTASDGAGPRWAYQRSPLTYNAAGTSQVNAHVVADTCTLGTNCAVTLAGSAAFTGSTTYFCAASDATAANAVKIAYTSGSAFTLTGTGTDVLNYVCVGR